MDPIAVRSWLEVSLRIAYWRTSDRHLAEDFSQDAIVKGLEFERREGRTPPVSFAAVVVEHDVQTWRRKRCARKRQVQPFPENFDPPSREPEPPEALEEKEWSSTLRFIVGQLEPKLRETARRHLIEQEPLLEIARTEGVPYRTIKRHYALIKRLLRKSLRDLLP